ncbi:MAG: hypothetical protein M1376_22470 [Planctomycetes bacterium]|nr:hypothetical protein [Planctomycetota bacterium]
MNDAEMDKLLERGLSGGPPRPGYREEVLADSVAALVRARRSRTRQWAGSLSAAAVLIAGVSFLLGRYSLPKPAPETAPVVTPVAAETRGVPVPNDLVAWLDAARLFHQLGMPDRMGRAVDRASRLLPVGSAATAVACGTAAPGREIEKITPEGGGATWTSDTTGRTAGPRFPILSALGLAATSLPLRSSSAENASPIMAQPLGD